MDRPESFHYGLAVGSVAQVYPNAWEVDLRGEHGEIIPRALVLGPRLPEVSTVERPQLCVYGYVGHLQGRAACWPVESRLPGKRTPREDVVYYDEVQNFRITVTREGVLEVRNSKGPLLQHRIIERDGVIRSDTPNTHIVQNDAEGSIDASTQTTRLTMRDSDGMVRLYTDGDLFADVGGDVTVLAGGDITLQNGGGAKIALTGSQVRING